MVWMVGFVGVPMMGVSSGCGNVMVVDVCVILTSTAAVAVQMNNKKRFLALLWYT
jgi:hypothetical protein